MGFYAVFCVVTISLMSHRLFSMFLSHRERMAQLELALKVQVGKNLKLQLQLQTQGDHHD